VFRVSLVRVSLKVRTSASALVGEKPRAVRLVALIPDAVSWRKVRRERFMVHLRVKSAR
jgi:hypothetical protein